MNQKGFANIVLIIVIVAIIAVGGYFAFVKKSEPIAQQQPTPTTIQTKTPTPSPTPTPEKKQTANCVNGKFGYELIYPVGWKVWTRGEGEARSATCSENLASYSFAKDLFGTLFKNQINLMVFTRDNQVKEFWQGVNSLDDYVNKTTLSIKKETRLGGERLVWLSLDSRFNPETDRLLAYHNNSIYEFSIYSVDSATLDKFLASFKFTK